MTGCARGCAIGVAGIILALLAFFLWPYRYEEIGGIISGNDTGCTVAALNHGGWRYESLALGVSASRVAYPLEIFVFVDACPDVPEGRPYATELVSLPSGRVIARGLSCADSRH